MQSQIHQAEPKAVAVPMIERCHNWAAGFASYMTIEHNGRRGRVVAVPVSCVGQDEVPVMFDDQYGCFVCVKATEIRLLPE